MDELNSRGEQTRMEADGVRRELKSLTERTGIAESRAAEAVEATAAAELRAAEAEEAAAAAEERAARAEEGRVERGAERESQAGVTSRVAVRKVRPWFETLHVHTAH